MFFYPLAYWDSKVSKHFVGQIKCSVLHERIPGYKRMDLQLLPTNMTKKLVWTQYTKANERSDRRLAAYTTFCSLWKKYVPQIIITKPQSDLYWVCQQNSRAITDANNASEDVKQQVHKITDSC